MRSPIITPIINKLLVTRSKSSARKFYKKTELCNSNTVNGKEKRQPPKRMRWLGLKNEGGGEHASTTCEHRKEKSGRPSTAAQTLSTYQIQGKGWVSAVGQRSSRSPPGANQAEPFRGVTRREVPCTAAGHLCQKCSIRESGRHDYYGENTHGKTGRQESLVNRVALSGAR